MSSIDRSFSEKRNFIRMKVNSEVSLQSQGKSCTGKCKDISGSGMRVETSEAFSVGEEVQVAINQKGENHLPFHAIAEVSRVDCIDDDHFSIGLSIIEIQE